MGRVGGTVMKGGGCKCVVGACEVVENIFP